MVYLFLGDDELRKQERIDQLKQIHLGGRLEQFNYENLATKGLSVKKIQESLKRLPTQGTKARLVVIRDIQKLSPKIKEFILFYAQKPFAHVILVLVAAPEAEEKLAAYSTGNIKTERFGYARKVNAFNLSRAITGRDVKAALRILVQLMHMGESPERILGALRYQLLREVKGQVLKQKKLACLLNTEFEIKTGKLKPTLALEKLVVRLCFF